MRTPARLRPLVALPRFAATLLALAACGDDAAAPPPDTSTSGGTVTLALERVATGLTEAVHVAAPPGDPRLFVVEQSGAIRVVRDGRVNATPFLDLFSRIRTGGEQGLLSLAFDPAFATNRRVYAYFVDTNGDIAVERFTAQAGSDVASATTGVRVITIPHPGQSNHNGGLAAFGPDGMLYLATGDGGGGGDPSNNAQNLGVLLGKVLRLDVGSLPYTIPSDNPYVGQAGRRGEIWAYGLRNPFRFAFDPVLTGGRTSLFIADVGQDVWEEVNVVDAGTAGVNYGWRIMEASTCFGAASCSRTGLTLPVHEYDHGNGCAITGGVVYRGAIAGLAGHYFFSDYCGGWLRSLVRDANGRWTVRTWDIPDVGAVRSFGEDGNREMYLATTTGVWKVVRR